MNATKLSHMRSKPTLAERTQRFLDAHPELIPQPLSYKSIGFDRCTECGAIRPKEEMLESTCGFTCHANKMFNLQLKERSLMD